MYPTTLSVCSNYPQFTITCDVERFMKVDYRLQELCPAARSWEWVKGVSRHPETQQFTKTMTVVVDGEFTSLRRYLATRLLVTEYTLSDELLAEKVIAASDYYAQAEAALALAA